MKKSALLRALREGILRHDLDTFMSREHKIVQTGCPLCERHFGTRLIKFLEARVGFEPTNDGFADHSLRPLGYRAPVCYVQNLCPKLCPTRPVFAYLRPITLPYPIDTT